MEQEDGIRETKFRLAKAVFVSLYEQGLITDKQLRLLLLSVVEMYHPMIGELEVNSIAGEKGYKG